MVRLSSVTVMTGVSGRFVGSGRENMPQNTKDASLRIADRTWNWTLSEVCNMVSALALSKGDLAVDNVGGDMSVMASTV